MLPLEGSPGGAGCFMSVHADMVTSCSTRLTSCNCWSPFCRCQRSLPGLLLARRFSKEARLTIRLERLAGIYPNLPDGSMREEFGRRVSEAGSELNARLDPPFKRERRRKRKVVAWVLSASVVLAFFVPEVRGEDIGNVVGVMLGLAAVGGFLLIKRDTKRQRAAIAAEQADAVST